MIIEFFVFAVLSLGVVICVVIFAAWHFAKSTPIKRNLLGKNLEFDNEEIPVARPFKIEFPTEKVNELRQILRSQIKNIVPPLEGSKFFYGFNPAHLKIVLEHWDNFYLGTIDDRIDMMNRYEHFKILINGLDIHFVRAKSEKNKTLIPILLLHGWPGSFIEFYGVLDTVIKKKWKAQTHDYEFDLIVPSLPGYGFSDSPTEQKFGPAQIAKVFRKLMIALGHTRFYVQGGDWGSYVGKSMAAMFPENVIGFHSNWLTVSTSLSVLTTYLMAHQPSMFISDKSRESWYVPVWPKLKFLLRESGYFHLQATKPDTIGMALTGNPAGLAAYILEKFSTWTNPDNRKSENGGLGQYFELNDLLDNVMIYYMSNCITSSVRLYKEQFADKLSMLLNNSEVTVPVGVTRFKYEVFHQPDSILKQKFRNIVHSTYHELGGHFAAMQVPDVFAEDLFKFIETVEALEKKKV